METLNWVRGYLHAFMEINERTNNTHLFVIQNISGFDNFPSAVDKLYETRNTYIHDAVMLANPEEELALALHGWMFVFLGFRFDHSDIDEDRLVDAKEHFAVSWNADYRTRMCDKLAKAICDAIQVEQGSLLTVRSDQSCLDFGRHFLLENSREKWWIWLGGWF